MKMVRIVDLFDLSHTLAKTYLEGFEYPWQALAGIENLIVELGENLPKSEYKEVKEHVWIHKTAKVFDSAYIGGPCIIGANTEVRQCAFIRGSALVGNDCVIGNSVELKNVIIFDSCQVPHFNYVGDSILGFHAHMGAGAITSNIKADKKNIVVHGDVEYETGLRKMGAMLGDFVDVGCNSVLNPGTVIGRNTNVYPMSCIRGVVKENCIYKSSEAIVAKENR
jgi:UDP-N-acetylglucosamine diphosphorylase / glucose-1-phosphate thymidylyltransferase / UDP-N-acetylgalactosamine diphosphorylase / glucosamine-1-phosphate N-acetyltransferase / galactosamine-1-phosphate N-acetyltransferase